MHYWLTSGDICRMVTEADKKIREEEIKRLHTTINTDIRGIYMVLGGMGAVGVVALVVWFLT